MLPDTQTRKPEAAVFHRVLRHGPTVLGLGLQCQNPVPHLP